MAVSHNAVGTPAQRFAQKKNRNEATPATQDHISREERSPLPDARRHPRFQFETDIKIYSRATGLLTGHTVDISESGISAILKIEAPLYRMVQLEFKLPDGPVRIQAVIRQRNAFRYGFEFVDLGATLYRIRHACSVLKPANPPPEGAQV